MIIMIMLLLKMMIKRKIAMEIKVMNTANKEKK